MSSPAINVAAKFLEANSWRVAIHIVAIEATGMVEGCNILTGTVPDTQFAFIQGGTILVMPYRDFGPVIREAIYVAPRTANFNIVVTEIFRIASDQ